MLYQLIAKVEYSKGDGVLTCFWWQAFLPVYVWLFGVWGSLSNPHTDSACIQVWFQNKPLKTNFLFVNQFLLQRSHNISAQPHRCFCRWMKANLWILNQTENLPRRVEQINVDDSEIRITMWCPHIFGYSELDFNLLIHLGIHPTFCNSDLLFCFFSPDISTHE